MRAETAMNRLPPQCRDKECKFRLTHHSSLVRWGVRPKSALVATREEWG
jgi:hypothetical protein